MWRCFPFCPLPPRKPVVKDAEAVSPSVDPPSPKNEPAQGRGSVVLTQFSRDVVSPSTGPRQPVKNELPERRGSFVLTQFSRDVERRRVEFAPPVPTLSRCSMCGLVPPRLSTSESCRHAFCSHCLDNEQAADCPFDGSAWVSAAPDTGALELVAKASVFCWNRSTGCSYVGCLLDMPSHYRKCPYYTTHCGVCGQEVRMKDLAAHASPFCKSAGGPDAGELSAVHSSRGSVSPTDPPRLHRLPSPTRSRKADFIWTIKPYSKISQGNHLFRSEPFLTKAGHMAQLLGSIDAAQSVELKAAASYLRGYKDQAPEWGNAPGTVSFRLLKNNYLGRISETLSAETVHENFRNNATSSAWQSVAKLDKARFEKDFVSGDAFVLEFTY